MTRIGGRGGPPGPAACRDTGAHNAGTPDHTPG
ncbi:hypothetical protein Ae706Ps2_2087c [Pseudonocardia sp. Ae706_Ps2]|nr:hypothetical protein Ae706Ps2_2087c [Pseudonocardia sp. Ae706_Ps2]